MLDPEVNPVAAGREARDLALARLEVNGAEFLHEMRMVAMRICKEQGQVSSDDLRDYALEHDIEPHHPNAWGNVFKGAGWFAVGQKASRYASNHARMIRIWSYRVGAGQ